MIHELCELQDLEDGRVSDSLLVSVQLAFTLRMRRWMDREMNGQMDE